MQTETEIERQVVEFGKRLRAARAAAGLSQLMLADRAGVDLAAVSFLERAKRAPNLNTLVRVARAVEVAPAALLSQGGSAAKARAGQTRKLAGGADGAAAVGARSAGARVGSGAARRASGKAPRSAARTGTVEALLRFGANLRAARLAAPMSQEELSATARIDRAAISIIERGERSANLRTIVKLAAALGKEPADLLTGVE
jgi:transcriptional regulator with XRE-family HTH domain